MAESNQNWFGSWLTAAKHKSNEVLEFVKKDLEEFGTAVKSEASSVVSSTGSAIEKTLKLNEPQSTASSMKRSISSFLGQMNNVLNPSPDDSDTEAILITEGSETVTLTKLQKAIYELQQDEKTYLEDPDCSLNKQYECWLEIIDDQLTEERLGKHLNGSVTLNNFYFELVPGKVSHQLFWKRYLFKKALLEDDLARQEALERREVKEQKQVVEETVKWEQVKVPDLVFNCAEDFASDIELTEEEQIRLLEQYENETKQKNQQKPPKNSLAQELIEESNQSPKKSKTDNKQILENELIGSEKLNSEKINEDHSCELSHRRVSNLRITKNDSSNSLDLEAKSSNSSSDGDWEKINDIDKLT